MITYTITIDVGLPINPITLRCKKRDLSKIMYTMEKNVKYIWGTDDEDGMSLDIHGNVIHKHPYRCNFYFESSNGYIINIVHFERIRQPLEMKSLTLKAITSSLHVLVD